MLSFMPVTKTRELEGMVFLRKWVGGVPTGLDFGDDDFLMC